MVNHFADTVILLVLEALLDLGVNLTQYVHPLDHDLIVWVNLISKWFCISALLLFAIECLVLVVLSGTTDVKRAAQGGKSREAGGL